MPGFLDPMDTYALTRTVKGYSSGTRVNVQNLTKHHTVFISIYATKEVIEVAADDIVKLRPRYRIVAINKDKENRRERLLRELTQFSQELPGGYR